MRVIAGSARGRRLTAGRGRAVRPTADKVKGALFSSLASRVTLESATILDLFAGSGALGIEALSRGAAHVTFVEHAATALPALRENLERCHFTAQARVLPLPVDRAVRHLQREACRFDGVLLDPPYGQGLVTRTLTALDGAGVVRPGAWIAVEHHLDEPAPTTCGQFRLTQARRYGKTGLAFFVAEPSMTQSPTAAHRLIRAVYPGSFDPITNGHLDVVRRALNVFDHVIVAVADTSSDPAKSGALFSAGDRVTMIHEALADTGGRATADSFSGLLVDYCERIGAQVIIRGLRAVSDFEYEFQMAMMNRHLNPRVETFFMTAGARYFYTSSRLVKQVAGLGGNVRELVPDGVYQRLLAEVRTGR